MSVNITYLELRRNLVPDPRATSLSGWSGLAGSGGVAAASLLTDVADHPLGISTAFRFTWTTGTSGITGSVRVGGADAAWGIPATPGTTYTGSLYARVNRTRDVRPQLVWLDAAGATLSTTSGTTGSAAANTWQRWSYTTTAPAGAVWVRVVLTASTTAMLAGDAVDVTGGLVEAAGAPAGDYFDGDTLPVAGTSLSYAWTAAENASPSTQSQQLVTVVDDPPPTEEQQQEAAFTPHGVTVWGLGDYDDPDLRFNGIDGWGVEWICETPEGWKRTTADTPIIEGGGDGGVFAPGRRKPKVLTLKGAFRCGDTTQMDAAEDRLRAAIEYLTADTLLWHGPTPRGLGARQMTVRLTGDLDVLEVPGNPRIRTFSAVLTAADPYRYAAGESGLIVYETGLTYRVDEGITFPLEFDMTFASDARPEGGIQGRIDAVNPGALPAFPEVTFTGPGPGLQLTWTEGGQWVGYAPTMLGNQQVTFYHRSRAVIGDGRSQFFNRLPGSEFFALPPNSTSTLGFVASVYNPQAVVRVAYRPAWP